jgi:hypothetical protein
VLHYQENDDDNDDDDDDDNNNNNNKLHPKVAHEVLWLPCVRSVCCGVLLHENFKSCYGVLCFGFSFNCFNLLPSARRNTILHTL